MVQSVTADGNGFLVEFDEYGTSEEVGKAAIQLRAEDEGAYRGEHSLLKLTSWLRSCAALQRYTFACAILKRTGTLSQHGVHCFLHACMPHVPTDLRQMQCTQRCSVCMRVVLFNAGNSYSFFMLLCAFAP